MEEQASIELGNGVIGLCTLIPKLREYIGPTLTLAYNLQDVLGDFNMKSVQVSEHGMWQTCICENAQTEQLHTENDCTYTVISVPVQDEKESIQPEYTFLFKLKEKSGSVGIKMDPGVTFLFSGKYLTHRQFRNVNVSSNNATFFNVASYGNKRLFSHLKSTIKRVVDISHEDV